MARGAESKAERKLKRKEARAATEGENSSALNLDLDNDFDEPYIPKKINNDSSSEEEEDVGDIDKLDIDKIAKRIKKGQQKRAASTGDHAGCCGGSSSSSGGGIKTTPLILLILLTGTTLLPALMYAGSWMGGALQKKNIFGSMGYKLGIGPTPKKRVMSFYEKHDASKLSSVNSIMAQYYGDYPKLIKKLERKYGDYGYFLQWENDEAPLKLAKEKAEDTFLYFQKIFNAHAPQVVKTGARNMKYNLGFLYKKASRLWKKKVWPHLEPFFGVPKGAEKQKRKDAETASRRKGRKRNTEFRDEDEF